MNWFRENISYDVKKTLLMNLRELKGSKSKPKDDAAMHLEVKNTQKKKYDALAKLRIAFIPN
jgi:hypothetical protein